MSLLPLILGFCLFFFVGVFFMIYFSTRSQEKALNSILQQVRAARLEVDRLAGALDALLAERELDDDGALGADDEAGEANKANKANKANVVGHDEKKISPAVDRLLLGAYDAHDSRDSADEASGKVESARSGALPDLRL